jgi:hypothetical protein
VSEVDEMWKELAKTFGPTTTREIIETALSRCAVKKSRRFDYVRFAFTLMDVARESSPSQSTSS